MSCKLFWTSLVLDTWSDLFNIESSKEGLNVGLSRGSQNTGFKNIATQRYNVVLLSLLGPSFFLQAVRTLANRPLKFYV